MKMLLFYGEFNVNPIILLALCCYYYSRLNEEDDLFGNKNNLKMNVLYRPIKLHSPQNYCKTNSAMLVRNFTWHFMIALGLILNIYFNQHSYFCINCVVAAPAARIYNLHARNYETLESEIYVS